MATVSIARPERELVLTRGHLFALGALSLALAVLSFFVGLQLGRTDAPVAPAPAVEPLVREEVRGGDLEVLLARVEAASRPHAELTFPEKLEESDPIPPPVDPAAPVDAAAVVAPPVDPFPDDANPRVGAATVAGVVSAPAPVAHEIPAGKWAVQVASRPDEADAAFLVDTLRAAGLKAYRVPALVDGQALWRVRVGGYNSKEGATAALGEVSARAGSTEALVTQAP